MQEISGADARQAKSGGTDRFGSAENLSWQRSTRCSTNSCLETARLAGGKIAIRDSKAAGASPILVFTADEWSAFTLGVKAGEFDF